MALDEKTLRAWSERRGEPSWLTRRRLEALSLLPADADRAALERALAEPIGRLGSLAPELAAQGVELAATAEAASRGWLNSLWGAAIEEPELEACWTGGVYARVPRGVTASLPIHVAAGLKRFGRLERSGLILGEGARAEFVEGCTELGGGPGSRWSLFEAWLGEGARLTGSSVQAWPFGSRSRALKRLRAARGARLNWTDVNLWAEVALKTIAVELETGAAADVLCGGFAAAGQRQALTVSASGPGRAELEVFAAERGGRVEASCSRWRRWAGGGDASLHAFFEPLARRLPLEFSVEFSRLLDTAILD